MYSDKIFANEFNWINDIEESEFYCFAKFRYRQAMQKVFVKKDAISIEIIPQEKQRSVTPGQFAVLYKTENDRTICLGGGEISLLINNGKNLDI